jgi:hypothetical protein
MTTYNFANQELDLKTSLGTIYTLQNLAREKEKLEQEDGEQD